MVIIIYCIIVEPQSKAGRSSDDDDDGRCRFGLGYYFNYVLPFNRSEIGILVGIANQNRLMSIARVRSQLALRCLVLIMKTNYIPTLQ